MASTVRKLHLTIDDQIENRYHPVSIDLSSASSLDVSYTYDTTRAVIDLGCDSPTGWRGWSGGARTRFAITPTAATPGYLPGQLPDGRWDIILGLHQLPADGIDVEVRIDVSTDPYVEQEPERPAPRVVQRASARALPAPAGLTWYAGDFHAHTYHSDGDQSPAQLALRAVERGLDFLAVTDHNTVSHFAELPGVGAAYDIALVPGQEVTTARGHANALGPIDWVDFRRPATDWVDQVAQQGGVLSINHPLDGDCAWQHDLPVKPRALELWHISWFRDLTATFPWALWPLWDPTVTLIGGSDFHNPGQGWPPGTPTTWVAAEECTPESILAAVSAGRTAITRFPTDPALVRIGDEIIAQDAEGLVLVDIDGQRRRVTSSREVFAADTITGGRGAGRAPYRLEDGERMVIAITK